MRTMRTKCSLWLMTAVLAGILVSLPGLASAAVKVIPPWSFLPYVNGQHDTQAVLGVAGSSGSALFWAPVKLPVGTLLKGVKYQHAAKPSGLTGVTFVRTKSTVGVQNIYEGSSTVATSTGFDYIDVSCVPVPATPKTVQAGWNYFLIIGVASQTTYVGKVSVIY